MEIVIYVFVVRFVVELNGTIHRRLSVSRDVERYICMCVCMYVWIIKVVFEENFVLSVSKANEFIYRN